MGRMRIVGEMGLMRPIQVGIKPQNICLNSLTPSNSLTPINITPRIIYLTYSAKSVRCMSPLRISVSCMAKAAVRQWRVWPILAIFR